MTNPLRSHLHHHGRFYVAAALGGITYVICRNLPSPLPLAITGDLFFLSYVVMMAVLTVALSAADLRAHAEIDDEGGAVVTLMALAALGYCCTEIFTVLNQKQPAHLLAMIFTLLGAPLGWLMFNMMAAFHYAYLFYRRAENGEPQEPPPLSFPKTEEPGVWEFLYYSFVVAMTAQTSDVDVQNSKFRRVTTLHSIVSFFFNTVLIAMSVNAVVAKVSG
ncbi:MAG TPA: DUF1345 domain-containing protein [Rhizomicrobium sp.]|jgi:uncharacterized membrane protein|nr:DUF1345 domain-containing protein [Rhizomicrobium sp.]